jgi:hypothetical protein
MSRYRGSPMTLGNAAAAQVRLIVSCLDCSIRSSRTRPRSPSGRGPLRRCSIGASGLCARGAAAGGWI